MSKLKSPANEIATSYKLLTLFAWAESIDASIRKMVDYNEDFSTSDKLKKLSEMAVIVNPSASTDPVLFCGMARPTYPINPDYAGTLFTGWGTIEKNSARATGVMARWEAESQPKEEADCHYRTNPCPADVLAEMSRGGTGAREYVFADDLDSRTKMAHAISRLYNLSGTTEITETNILFTVGAHAALYSIFEVVNTLSPRGRIITTTPHCHLYNGIDLQNRLHTIDLMQLPGYQLSPQALREAIESAKKLALEDGGAISALLFCYPNSPTGTVLSAKEWRALADIIVDEATLNDIPIILDEVYAEIFFGQAGHSSLLSIAPELANRIILIRSASMGMSAAGDRIGIVACKNISLLKRIRGVQSDFAGHAGRMSAHAYASALYAFDQAEQLRISKYYGTLVDLVQQGLCDIGAAVPDQSYVVKGTFYVLANLSELMGLEMHADAKKALPDVTHILTDECLVYHLLFAHRIMLAPLSYFGGNPKKGFVRITCTDIEDCLYLIERLGKILSNVRSRKCDRLVDSKALFHDLPVKRQESDYYPIELLIKLKRNGYSTIEYGNPAGDYESRKLMAMAMTRLNKLSEKRQIRPDDILFTVGGSSALAAIFKVINTEKPHGRIITTVPFHSLHLGIDKKNRLYTIDLMKLPGFKLTPQALKQAIDVAKKQARGDGGEISALLFCDPHNPAGSVLDAEDWHKIASVILADKSLDNIPIVLDESYAEMRIDGKEHCSLLEVSAELEDRIILLRSATKSFSMAGERMAVIVCKNHNWLSKIITTHAFLNRQASQPLVRAYAEAIYGFDKHEQQRIIDFYGTMVRSMHQGLRDIGAALADKNYVVKGTFYVLADLSDLIGVKLVSDANLALPNITTIYDDHCIAYHLLFKAQVMISALSYFGGNRRKGYMRITCNDIMQGHDLIERISVVLKEARQDKCEQFASTIKLRLRSLAEDHPQAAKDLLDRFNVEIAKYFASFTVSQSDISYNMGDLDTKNLKDLLEKLKEFSIKIASTIVSLTPESKLATTMKLRLGAMAHMLFARNNATRFRGLVDQAWFEWVNLNVPAEFHLAAKRLPLFRRKVEYPKWGQIFNKIYGLAQESHERFGLEEAIQLVRGAHSIDIDEQAILDDHSLGTTSLPSW